MTASKQNQDGTAFVFLKYSPQSDDGCCVAKTCSCYLQLL